MESKTLILGSSSWLGYLLLNELSLKFPNIYLAGTVYKQRIDVDVNIKFYFATNLEDYKQTLNDFKPTVIVNFLRGEGEEGQLIHRLMIDYSSHGNAYYLYASSALALDAYEGRDLTENILAKSKSEYGQFKAKCEQILYDSRIDWCILRFASVQGWVKHKITRNENLLLKLSKGERIIVDKGVCQNRMLADLMIKGIAELINLRTQGIIHFGTADSSDEFDFLKRQAVVFGYSSELIERSNHERNVNLFCIPNRIYDILGESYKVMESDTLRSLSEIPQLKNYRL
jgi:dTDP-4-dehydrorhamnose reductase